MGIDELRACAFWTDREGRAALSLLRRSGLSAAAFARREGLSRTRLLYWRSRVESGSAPLALAPVTVIEARRSGVLAIECLSGRVVRIEGDVDDALLARVIVAAERAC
jgi:hypothetical protein